MHAQGKSADDIEGWIIDYLVRTLGLAAMVPRPETRLLEVGLDSVEAVGLADALEGWLGTSVTPTIAWEQPTIAALARYLSGEESAPARGEARTLRDHDATSEDTAGGHPFATFVNPEIGRLLGQLALDKRFVRGEGCTLHDHEGRRYIDFIAAYGALPLGHNPPEIWDALLAARAEGVPNFVQPSYLEAAGQLAARLLTLTPPGMRYVTFANSGAEAMEAAIKMCRMATGRLGILSTEGSFHGKTLGALSATGNPRYQGSSGAPVPHFDLIPYGDPAALRAAFASRPGHYAAFLVEPIQGEGGIVEPPPGYLSEVRDACDQAGVLLVFDEIQTGLGRTGRWFACEHDGVVPDVMALAKALGGGLVPIGAVVAAAHVHTEEFGLKHSSTFAGGGLACRVGLAMLERLARDEGALIRQVAENGRRFKDELERLASRYPHLIAEVRGRGFLLGLRFAVHRRTWPSSILAVAAEEGGLAPIFASYLLNVEGVRLAPTLNGTDVIRIEPPLVATWDDCETVLAAIARALEAFAVGDAARVLGSICARAPRTPLARPRRSPPRAAPRPRQGDGRFAFLLHPLDLQSYADFDPSLAALPPDELEAAVRCVHGLASPAVVGDARISSASGHAAYGEFILVGHTADELLAMSHEQAVAVIREAVDLARDRGARIVGLGAFTSIVTQGGRAVSDAGVPVTSGNSYTVVAAHDALMLALAERRTSGHALGTGRMRAWPHQPAAGAMPAATPASPGPARGAAVAVIGAGGAIGRALAILMAQEAASLVLVGNPQRSAEQARARLLDVAAAACRYVIEQAARDPDRPRGALATHILTSGDPPPADASLEAFYRFAARLDRDGALVLTQDSAAAAREADALLMVTSATGALLEPEDIRPDAIICDVSRPHNIGPELRAARPDVQVIDGGIIAIPGQPDIGCFGLPIGHAYACMAETMTLALDQRYEHMSLGGELDLAAVDSLRALAMKHGFRVVAPHRAEGAPPAERERA